ncbi:MAG TPA: M1 family aminopeptidase, partial [Bryobacteraceae bacterium]|nr:M1 family aminopeptidase [Bryobacteraceae bacterium]
RAVAGPFLHSARTLLFFAIATLASLLIAALPSYGQDRVERNANVNVDHYAIQAEINPHTQTITAAAQVHFTTLDRDTSTLSFELNNALTVSKVTDDSGQELSANRSQQDFSDRVTFAQPLPKGKTDTLSFTYGGQFTGNEDSPVFGIRFAAIHDDHSFLLYPARWFPVYGYTTDRFSADLRITVPNGYTVIAAGDGKSDKVSADKTVYTFHYAKSSFPGSIAIVQGDPQQISADGVTTTFYLREKRNVANAYGSEIGKITTYLTSVYGLPPQANLTVIETEAGAPNGYAAPGILFLSPKSMTDQPPSRLLANQISRQWWGVLVSPTTRNHMWLENGQARYAELLYTEHTNGAAAFQSALHDTYVEALTVDNPPLIQAARLEDYSPEFWAATAGKGAAVLSMLRDVIGDKNFFQLLKAFPDHYSYKSVSTEDFRKAAESISGQDLQYFFIQWIESSGAPEFKMTYTVFRTAKGFRVMGKVAQDLDTFRMPVDLKIETEGNPEEKKVEVVGTSSEFTIDTFGKPKSVVLDPDHKVLRFSNPMRVAVAIRRGEQFVEVGELNDALKEYQKALDVNRNSSLAHYRVAEIFFMQNNYQSAANEFRDALNGDLDPRWTEVWSHINLGKIFDITGQRDRAVNEYKQATRTKDNTQGALEDAAKYIQHPYQRKQSET